MSTVSIPRSIRKIYQLFADVPIKKGTVLHKRYKVLQVIGTGSYGIVYLCQDMNSMETIVVKQLRPSRRHNHREVKLFHNEVHIVSMLNHTNMPTLYETFQHNGNHFYVMSYMEGDNLDEQIFLNKATFTEKESLLIIDHLLELIAHLHKKDIYHLDLRIPNILLNNNEPYLIDFGLAKQADLEKQNVILEMKQQDYFDLGDILLYLLYTTYRSKSKKALPWTEELLLEEETVHLLKRLLQLNNPYTDIREVQVDFQAALTANNEKST